MPAKRRVAVTAPYDRWVLLGKLLEARRRHLGYTYRAPGFERDRGVNRRLAADLEVAAPKRVDHFTEGSLRLAARGYQVAYDSVLAVLLGEADELAPAAPAARGLPSAPIGDAALESAVRPYAAPVYERVLDLADAGVRDPSGAQLGLSPADAKVWDGSRGAMSRADRAWLVGEIRLGRRRRAANPEDGAAGA